MKHETKVERKSERELVASRIINGPPPIVFEAWTQPELFKKWWVPKSAPITLLACDMDIRTGGKYRLRFGMGDQNAEFFGRYLEVTPHSRIVWTNEEGGDAAAVITTVTLAEINGATRVTVHDLYPSKAALDEAIASESTGAMPEQLEQLDQFVVNARKH
ncbi:MAG TPA: SRPBCC domain-containing protein [bacterium]